MDKILSFALLALAGYRIISSFVQEQEFGSLFGLEINIWLYRGIWLLVGVLAINSLRKKINLKK
ncbi:MAG TPA: hypothetical protein EYN07_06435 [Flavobacteriaceae bacterium]|jgi:hypothetical protein|nr:hypothetical protein [Flavobacteriaceae bacterium]MAM27625.1 hypothetical protein [Flavobacteriaceae bacterium]MAY51919.1 hypothetical protein [Flavobacteriaceae bacterium]HBR52777.1 hypothetical protein [Flavobacteriaceae bacterium]HIB49420.1 hypothetical protein [Flavobacteriaceae bacterium]|tara:strand:+ start:287 stop:478 length:192 start_codon:yes stop_codon:yes gene_type:complete